MSRQQKPNPREEFIAKNLPQDNSVQDAPRDPVRPGREAQAVGEDKLVGLKKQNLKAEANSQKLVKTTDIPRNDQK